MQTSHCLYHLYSLLAFVHVSHGCNSWIDLVHRVIDTQVFWMEEKKRKVKGKHWQLTRNFH